MAGKRAATKGNVGEGQGGPSTVESPSNTGAGILGDLVEEVRRLRIVVEHATDADRYNKPMDRERAAEYLGVHPDTLYRWAHEGLIAFSRIGEGAGAKMFFSKRDIDESLSNGRVPSVGELRASRN